MRKASTDPREIWWRGQRVGYVKDVTLETSLATTRKLRGRWDPVDTDAARDFTKRLFSGESFAVTLPAGGYALSAAGEGTVFLLIHGRADAAVSPE
ncbi:MAG: hypothetical protein LJF15_21300 [Acidobacteria bacterium]|jgi:hypothetical protein|nr:hypothetical protein [Acidobacteriota bacterium]